MPFEYLKKNVKGVNVTVCKSDDTGLVQYLVYEDAYSVVGVLEDDGTIMGTYVLRGDYPRKWIPFFAESLEQMVDLVPGAEQVSD
ncbi:MAG: hypothetical protein OXQ29_14605 [Rhodospirillaceae bacterium]|nr:hypothetical protein [Rhodospirillaceae bacterium]